MASEMSELRWGGPTPLTDKPLAQCCSAGRPIPYVITVDTEEEWDWTAPWPVHDGYTVTNAQSLPRFQALCERYGAKVTYFVNHAVLADRRAREVILDLAGNPNVEIGMHIHPWNTPPLSDEPVTTYSTFLHNLPEELARSKLENTYLQFREAGLVATSFRGGRYSCGDVGQRFLAERRFVVDASVCPFSTWPDEGAPDYRRRDLQPRRVFCANVPSYPLWEIPLTLAFTRRPWQFWRWWYHLVERSLLRYFRIIGFFERVGVVRRVWLNFECESYANMLLLLKRLARWGVSHVCFTVHSSSLAVGPNPYARTQESVERIYRTVEAVLQYLSHSCDFTPLTVTHLGLYLEEAFHESAGN